MQKHHKNLPCVVSIAGTDPSGGAGIHADIKGISATGSYAAAIVTVLVAQNTQGVQTIYPITPEFVSQQIQSVFEDLDIHAVKLGMLYNLEIIQVVTRAMQIFKPKHLVIDPVMVAKDGSMLLDFASLDFLKKQLFPLADIITPNLLEAEKIRGHTITSLNQLEDAAKTLGETFQTNILIKGSRLPGEIVSDVLYLVAEKTCHVFQTQRIQTANIHGTGCTLSAAIASYLAQQYSLTNAVQLARKYLLQALEAGSQLKIGQGCGPVDHFYFLNRNNNTVILNANSCHPEEG